MVHEFNTNSLFKVVIKKACCIRDKARLGPLAEGHKIRQGLNSESTIENIYILSLFGATGSPCALQAWHRPCHCITGKESRRRAWKTAALQDRAAVRPGTACMIIWAFSILNLVHVQYNSWSSPTVATGVIVKRYYILLFLVQPLRFPCIWAKLTPIWAILLA